jgi:hypothetical protein
MSTLVKIAAPIVTLALVSLIGAASVMGWGLDRPAQQTDEEYSKAYNPERGYIIYYGTMNRGGRMGGSGGFRGGK